MLYSTVGLLGAVLALAGFAGVLIAGEAWAHTAGDVLGTAMTPVGVIAAASIVMCVGAVLAAEANPNRQPGANDVIANMAGGYGIATSTYFGFALAALAFKEVGIANTLATAAAFAWLGLVLGSSVTLIVRLSGLWSKPEPQAPDEHGSAPTTT